MSDRVNVLCRLTREMWSLVIIYRHPHGGRIWHGVIFNVRCLYTWAKGKNYSVPANTVTLASLSNSPLSIFSVMRKVQLQDCNPLQPASFIRKQNRYYALYLLAVSPHLRILIWHKASLKRESRARVHGPSSIYVTLASIFQWPSLVQWERCCR